MPTTSESSLPRAGLYHPLDLRSDAVDEWVAGLPLANLGETCRLLFASLREINAGELAAAQRYKTLEALRETLHYLGNALRQRFLGTAFPLPVKTRKIANLLREMQLEMAKGYQAAAHQILLQNSLRQDYDTLTASLQRSLYYFGQSFLAGYQIYSDPEPSHWREVYGLYAEAERRGLPLGAIRDKFKHGNPATTISKTFKQILLLPLADPLRLTQTEMTAAYHLLETAAEQCQLRLAADGGTPRLSSTRYAPCWPKPVPITASSSPRRRTRKPTSCRAISSNAYFWAGAQGETVVSPDCPIAARPPSSSA